MVSSGIYERYFYDKNGTFYHHILDSKTGYPCDAGLLQVTIISKESATGHALSTACFALGLEKADSFYAICFLFYITDTVNQNSYKLQDACPLPFPVPTAES